MIIGPDPQSPSPSSPSNSRIVCLLFFRRSCLLIAHTWHWFAALPSSSTLPPLLTIAGVTDQGNVKLTDPNRPQGLDLLDGDFAWLTKEIQHVADICCEGRVVSVLEGGYGTQVHERKTGTWSFNREQFAANVASHVKVLTS